MADIGDRNAEGAYALGVLRLPGTDVPLVEALLDGVVVADTAGAIIYANRTVEAMLGWPPSVLQGQPVTVLIPPRLRGAHQSAFAAFAAGGPPRLVGRPLRLPALTVHGAEVPIELLLSTLPLRSGGRLVVATLRNAAERVDLERHSQVAEGLLALLATGPDGLGPRLVEVVAESLDWDAGALWTIDPDGVALRSREFWHRPAVDVAAFASATAMSTFTIGVGLPGRVLADREPTWIADLELDPNFPRAAAAEAAGLRSGFAFPVLAGSRVIGVLELFARQRREPDDALLASMGVLGQRLGEILAHAEAERERERRLDELRSAQAAQHDLLRTQHFLLGAARVLAEAADYTEALDRLAAVAVPLLGDLCLIDVLADDGNLIRMVARHADPAKQPIVEELRERYTPDPNGAHPSVDVIRTGRSRWSSEMSDDFLRATTRDDHHFALVRELEFTSYVSVPLIAGERALGSLTLVSAGSGRRFGESDLALAEELAGNAAAVIDRARRHDRQREAAHTLQRSFLPDELPLLAGAAAAARYLPGTEGEEVGGDWYDVIPLAHGAVGLAIGDVAGHDMGAAAEMGQLRNVLRGYAVRDDSPATVLHELRRFCEVVGIERIATVTYVWLSPGTGRLRMASAGHFPALIRRVTGAVEMMELSPAPPLGLESSPSRETEAHLERGDAVVLFTDGLVERRGAHPDDGLNMLTDTVASAPAGEPEALCDLIIERVVEPGARDDDVALLVVVRR